MRIYLVPEGGWVSALAGAIEAGQDGDMILVRGADMLTLAQNGWQRMYAQGRADDLRFAEYDDFVTRIRHDCGIADVEPISGEWVEVRDG